ncbi:hypothetical protein OSB04_005986 [Centaurea solstitialis]|uniref:Integrase catalytic domain-containing protein n=1 Tax=Centaurea solstitialis TaxID=347529 RepID=A0AA38WSE5_9ASTR|nr:hypothetical protein OSB04_005986 [Centaurea solstitialis]
MYVGKGYLRERLFKLYVVPINNVDVDMLDMNKTNTCTSSASMYMTDSSFFLEGTHLSYGILDLSIAEVENQLDKRIKILRFDRGGEYVSKDLAEFCSTHGIIHQTMAPYTPQQNGLAERKNTILKNMINLMLITSGEPPSLWGEACLAANSILNRIPHKKSDKSQCEL